MAKDLSKILLNEAEELAIKENTPDNMPINPTSQGWTGNQVRRFLAKAIINAEGSIISEFKKKMIEIKSQFEDIFGQGDGAIQQQITDLVDDLVEGLELKVTKTGDDMTGALDMTGNNINNILQAIFYNSEGNAVAYFDSKDFILSYGGILREYGKNLFIGGKAREIIANGVPMQYDGTTGVSGKVYIKNAVPAEININPHYLIGISTTPFTSGEEKDFNNYGAVNQIDTTNYNGGAGDSSDEGKEIFFDSINGGITLDRPIAPNVQISLGVLSIYHATQGQIKVKINTGFFLKDLHDLDLNGGAVAGDIIIKNVANTKFVAFNLTQALIDAVAVNDAKLLLKEDKTNKGIAGGYPGLNSLGIVFSEQLPSYIDNIVEYDTYADLPLTGVSNRIYVVLEDETSYGNVSQYRWSGTVYTQISNTMSPAEIKELYENNANTNEFTDAEKAKVNEVDTLLDDKVDKVIGSSLVTDLEIAHLEALDTQAQLDAKFDLKANIIDLDKVPTELEIEGGINDTDGLAPLNGLAGVKDIEGRDLIQTVKNGNSSQTYTISAVETEVDIDANGQWVLLSGYDATKQTHFGTIGDKFLFISKWTGAGNFEDRTVLRYDDGTFETFGSAGVEAKGEIKQIITLAKTGLFNTKLKHYTSSLGDVEKAFQMVIKLPDDITTLAEAEDFVGNEYLPYGLNWVRNPKVKSVGKNKFDKDANDNVPDFYINFNTGLALELVGRYATSYIRVIQNTNYYTTGIQSGGSTVGRAFYDINKKYISGETNTLTPEFTTPSNCYYVRETLLVSTFELAQIEVGSVATDYTPYIEGTVQYFADFHDNDTIKLQGSGVDEEVVKFLESWSPSSEQTDTILFAKSLVGILDMKDEGAGAITYNNLIIGDVIFNNGYSGNQMLANDIECVGVYSSTQLLIRINKSRLDGITSADLEEFLQNNNIFMFIYKLANKLPREIAVQGQLIQESNTTFIQEGLAPKVTLLIAESISSLAKNNAVAIKDLEIEMGTPIMSTPIPFDDMQGRFALSKDGMKVAIFGENELLVDSYNTETLEQVVVNGNFASDITGWSSSVSTNTWGTTGYLINTGSGVSQYVPMFDTSSDLILGVKYHIKAKVRVTNALCTSFSLEIRDSSQTYGTLQTVKSKTTPTENEWYILDDIVTVTDTNKGIYIQHNYGSTADATGAIMQVKEARAIPLPDRITTVEQVEKVAPVYFEGLQGVVNPSIKSIGKNKFDKETMWFRGEINTSGAFNENGVNWTAQYIPVISGETYIITNTGNVDRQRYRFDDINKNMISFINLGNIVWTEWEITIPEGVAYLSIYGATITEPTNFQLELGEEATKYEDFKSSTLDIIGSMFKLPNGVEDDLKVKRTSGEYILTEDDIDSIIIDTANVDYVKIGRLEGQKAFETTFSVDENVISIEGFTSKAFSESVANINTYFTWIENDLFALVVADNTYADLAEAKTGLAGTKIIYQLETPVPRILPQNGALIINEDTTYIHTSESGVISEFKVILPNNTNATIGTLIKMNIEQTKDIKDMNVGEQEDLTFPANQSVQGNTQKPDYDFTNVGLLFPQDVAEIVTMGKEFPHRYKAGSPVDIHIHLIQTEDAQIEFTAQYRWYNGGAEVPSWITVVLKTYAFAYVSGSLHQILYIPDIDGTGKEESSWFEMKVYRSDTAHTAEVLVKEFSVHYQVDKFGKNIL